MMNAYVVTYLTILLLASFADASDPPKDDCCLVDGKYYKEGEQWQMEGECTQATCLEGGAIGKLGCAKINVDEAAGWTLTAEDDTKPYPECCPKPMAPSST